MANPMYGQNKSDTKIDVLKAIGDGDHSTASYLTKYLDFLSGNQGNFAGTGIDVTEGEATAALAAISSPDAADTLAASLIPDAINTCNATGAGAGTMHLPNAVKGTHLCISYTQSPDATTGAHTIACAGGTGVTGTNELAKQIIGNLNGGIAGSAVLTAGTAANPTSVNLIYTPAAAATNGLGTGSVIHFFAVEDGEWLVRADMAPEGTGATGAFSVS